ncbi:Chromo domain containing protein [Aphelenchoides avenae]|nr:Chromo domain containing protein [Aphelenchus avenae]
MSSGKKSMKRKQSDTNNHEEEFEFEAILDKKSANGKKHFLVKWVGWPTPTWEPIENFADCKNLIKDFERRRKAERVLGKSLLPDSVAGKASKGRFKVERGAKVAQVLGACVRDDDDGTRNVFAKVQYEDKTTEIVPTAVLLKQCPMTLFAFYESRLKFE